MEFDQHESEATGVISQCHIHACMHAVLTHASAFEVCVNAAVTTAAMQTSVESVHDHRIYMYLRRRCQTALSKCSPRLREELARNRNVLQVLAGNPRELARPADARLAEALATRATEDRESLKLTFQEA